MMKKIIFLIAVIALFGSDQKLLAKGKEDLEKSFMCRRMWQASLRDLKSGLIKDCNLNRPYSIGTSNPVGSGDTYYYCCHKAK